jgi:hypothetical protein
MKKPLLLSSSMLVSGLAALLCAATASAQNEPPPASAPPPIFTNNPSPAAVAASGEGAGIGVGGIIWLDDSGPEPGAEFVYDQSLFHIEAGLGYSHFSPSTGPGHSDTKFGVGGWYHLLRGLNADFSLGGALGMWFNSPATGNTVTHVSLEPGAEARVFLTPNFALAARIGVVFDFANNTGGTTIGIGGQGSGSLSFTYFFR